MKYRLSLFTFLCLVVLQLSAQKRSNIKFGKISPSDFKAKIYSLDSNASAVIIADIGSTEIIASPGGKLALEFKHFRRVHILDKNGYEAGDVEVPLYSNNSGKEEEMSGIKAVTYNLENGRVTETKLNARSEVFTDRKTQNWTYKKFTFPNVREGSIIEYEYTIRSDFLFNLRAWDFQGKYPELWSEYKVGIPEFLYYVFLSQGHRKYDITQNSTRRSVYYITRDNSALITEEVKVDAMVTDYRWVMKNVNSLKDEGFTSTLQNHICRINFQLAEYRLPLVPETVMSTWEEVCDNLLKREDFGFQLDKDYGWLHDAAETATAHAQNDLAKAQNIFTYIQDHITCTGRSGIFMEKSLRNILRAGSGNVADINLLLTAMLKVTGLKAEPVILSTRDHGYAYDRYPVLDQFNYVITLLTLGDKNYYLDASDPQLGFGKLRYQCYNGHARIVTGTAPSVYLYSDSVVETKFTSVLLVNSANGTMAGSMQQTPGYFESSSMRSKIRVEGENKFFTDFRKGFNADIETTKESFDSLEKHDGSIRIHYDFTLKNDSADIFYFNPMLKEGWKENPFKSAKRFYPVEMPYAWEEIYSLRIDVPSGYVVDELPKQLVVKLNEKEDGIFEYRISLSNNSISLRSRLSIKRAYFLPGEYDMLRSFFNLVVKKHAEQIVFKRSMK